MESKSKTKAMKKEVDVKDLKDKTPAAAAPAAAAATAPSTETAAASSDGEAKAKKTASHPPYRSLITRAFESSKDNVMSEEELCNYISEQYNIKNNTRFRTSFLKSLRSLHDQGVVSKNKKLYRKIVKASTPSNMRQLETQLKQTDVKLAALEKRVENLETKKP